jgi:hypothetical protein
MWCQAELPDPFFVETVSNDSKSSCPCAWSAMYGREWILMDGSIVRKTAPHIIILDVCSALLPERAGVNSPRLLLNTANLSKEEPTPRHTSSFARQLL